MSGWYHPKAPYNSILRHIKDKGIRVFHREIKSGAAGLFDCHQTIITIDKNYRDTWEGCLLLLHEFSHFNQYREGKYLKFFEECLKFTEENYQLVIDAERDAMISAAKMLKMWGIKDVNTGLGEKDFEEYKKFWLKYYFNKK